ncbi:hypothetical protein J2T09_002319 [Neorhizobium huautlense]|uniref:Transposase n=1 Tax=Neorhizobium huautlense TaxID=67774 RepID=A0ABT9PSX4_9HYPH|nr:hypothetical protein [Neorhizobium huautlense]
MGRLFPVVIASGLRSVRHALTPRREMRHTLNFLLCDWFQENLWASISNDGCPP